MTAADGRVAVVTGAVSGIGEELSRGLVAKGWKVAGLDLEIQRPAANELSKELGESFNFIPADVSKYTELAEAFTKTFNKWNRIDSFCSNAGVSRVPFRTLLHYCKNRSCCSVRNDTG